MRRVNTPKRSRRLNRILGTRRIPRIFARCHEINQYEINSILKYTRLFTYKYVGVRTYCKQETPSRKSNDRSSNRTAAQTLIIVPGYEKHVWVARHRILEQTNGNVSRKGVKSNSTTDR